MEKPSLQEMEEPALAAFPLSLRPNNFHTSTAFSKVSALDFIKKMLFLGLMKTLNDACQMRLPAKNDVGVESV